MQGFPKMFTLCRLGFQALYLAIAVSLILWLALGLPVVERGHGFEAPGVVCVDPQRH